DYYCTTYAGSGTFIF
nr:immunoglobulin light chain junction region [Macaca mulatta]MOX29041.1 immunoglobulin light chain junction region [Macaca mulatta]MOX29639.1 immunoglobulin light chain junction region [Macaca mulatta]MOX31550.1 immunoglobulin light chain junction region [Macaca mulatta]MOX31761.1 immunoglobulin light chain junction region [Macaca mulatta]